MKTLLSVCAVMMMALTAGSARAADVTGTWSAQVSTPNGDFQLIFTFKQAGAALTGTVQGPQGDSVAISDGKVEGNKLWFKISLRGTTITHEGTVSAGGDEITLSTRSDSGDFPSREMRLKRVKPPPPAAVPAAALRT